MGYSQNGQQSLVKGQNCEFRSFRKVHPSKRKDVLKIFRENKAFYFSKREFYVSTARNG